MRNWTSILLILVLGACGQKGLSVEDASLELCNCFNSHTTGTIDEKLGPCFQEIGNKKNNEWNESGLVDQDSIRAKFSSFSLEVMLDMTRTCDNYFMTTNAIYDEGYSVDTTETNRNAINVLSARIKKEVNLDSVKSLLHKRVYKLIQAREFDLALQSIDSIKSLDKTDYGANLASAYIFNQKGFHDKAVAEIDRAIELSGNQNYKLYAEIARQKKRTSKE